MCPHCRRRLVEIAVQLSEIAVTMHACSACDRRWWDLDGRPLELDAVLALAAARP